MVMLAPVLIIDPRMVYLFYEFFRGQLYAICTDTVLYVCFIIFYLIYNIFNIDYPALADCVETMMLCHHISQVALLVVKI